MTLPIKWIARFLLAALVIGALIGAYLVIYRGIDMAWLLGKFSWFGDKPGVSVEAPRPTPPRRDDTADPVEPKKIVVPPSDGAGTEPNGDSSGEPAADAATLDLERTATFFATRFGSYSNQANFANIKDLYIYMSPRMRVWSEAYLLDEQKKARADDAYYAITTTAVATETTRFDEAAGQAEVTVLTRRREASVPGEAEKPVFAQEITVSFVRSGGSWQIDSANWR